MSLSSSFRVQVHGRQGCDLDAQGHSKIMWSWKCRMVAIISLTSQLQASRSSCVLMTQMTRPVMFPKQQISLDSFFLLCHNPSKRFLPCYMAYSSLVMCMRPSMTPSLYICKSWQANRWLSGSNRKAASQWRKSRNSALHLFWFDCFFSQKSWQLQPDWHLWATSTGLTVVWNSFVEICISCCATKVFGKLAQTKRSKHQLTCSRRNLLGSNSRFLIAHLLTGAGGFNRRFSLDVLNQDQWTQMRDCPHELCGFVFVSWNVSTYGRMRRDSPFLGIMANARLDHSFVSNAWPPSQSIAAVA